MRLRQRKEKDPLTAFRCFEVEDSDSLREFKERYSASRGFSHRTAIRRIKLDGAHLDVVAAVARRKPAQ